MSSDYRIVTSIKRMRRVFNRYINVASSSVHTFKPSNKRPTVVREREIPIRRDPEK